MEILLHLLIGGLLRRPAVPGGGVGCAVRATAVAMTTPADYGRVPTRLFVGGVPFGMSEAELARIFDGVALPHEVKPVVEVCLAARPDGSSRGFAFVQLATGIQAERAKAMLHGRAVSYGGRMPTNLVVRPATEPPTPGVSPRPLAGRQLWVGNLSFAARPAP